MNMKQCKYCGSENPVGALKCRSCNMQFEVSESSSKPPKDNAYDDTIMIPDNQAESVGFCPECGKMIHSHMECCGACGYDLRDLNLSERIVEVAKQKKAAMAAPQKVSAPIYNSTQQKPVNRTAPSSSTIKLAVIAAAMFLIGGTSVGVIMKISQQKSKPQTSPALEMFPTETTTVNQANYTAVLVQQHIDIYINHCF